MILYLWTFLLYVIVIISEISLVIVLTRWDIVNAERLAHVILLDWVKQKFSLTVNMSIFKVNVWILTWEASSLETHYEIFTWIFNLCQWKFLIIAVMQISLDLRSLSILSKDWYTLTLKLLLRHDVYIAKRLGISWDTWR